MTKKTKPRSMTIRFQGNPEQRIKSFGALAEALTREPFNPNPGNARCNYCNGPMPCHCEGHVGQNEVVEADTRARNRVDIPHVDC